jgi:ABC-2 type transport system permease protein
VAAHLLRLRLDLLLGAFRPSARRLWRSIAGLVAVIAVVSALAWAILRLREAPAEVVGAVTVIAGSAVTLGFLLAPLVVRIEDPLDPRRFRVLGLPPVPLTATLFVAGFVSVSALALIVLGACLVVLWRAQGVPTALAIAGVVTGLVTCALAGKVGLLLSSRIFPQRRSRELTGVALVVLLVVIVPLAALFASLEWEGRVPAAIAAAVQALSLSPLGAAWAIPGAGAAAASVDMGLAVAIAVATAVVLAGVWGLLVHRVLTTIERPASPRDHAGLGWFALMPGTPAGAIAARSLVYWLRDPRYLVNVVIIPIGSVAAALPLLVVGVPLPLVALLPPPLMALFYGWLAHNDLAYDSTALWMHISSGVRGAADRSGRLLPVTLIAVPLLAIAIPVAVALHGRAFVLPMLTGVCAALLLTGFGLSSISSAVAPYPVSGPGDSPFQQPQRTGGGLAQGVVLFGAIALSAPTFWWAWQALTVDPTAAMTALWGGLAIGAVVLIIGIAVGGIAFTRRSGRLMEFAEAT